MWLVTRKFRSCKPCVCIATKQIPHDCIFQYKTSLEWYRPLNLCEEHLSGMSEAPSCCQRVPSSFSYTWSLFSSVPWRERFDTATIVPSTVQITSAFISTTQLTLLYIVLPAEHPKQNTYANEWWQLSVLLYFIHSFSFLSFLSYSLTPFFLPVYLPLLSPAYFILLPILCIPCLFSFFLSYLPPLLSSFIPFSLPSFFPSSFPSFLPSHSNVPVPLLNTSTCAFL